MRLWSFQPAEVAEQLLAGESFHCDPALSELYSMDDALIREAYDWLAAEMEHSVARPDSVELPVWAWFRNHGEERKPDRRRYFFKGHPRSDPILELEVPDELVVLTDFDDWHSVLNGSPILAEEEWEQDEYRSFTADELLESWQQVFSVEAKDFVQATLWTIEPQWLVRIHWLGPAAAPKAEH